MEATVLIVDNNPDFFDDMRVFLKDSHLTAIHAVSLGAAYVYLEQAVCPMMICDVRMKDDKNPDDFSGLELVRDERFAHVPKIVATAHEDSVKDRLPDFFTNIIAFRNKNDPEELAQEVAVLYQRHVTVNWDLRFRYNQHFAPSFIRIADLLYPHAPNHELVSIARAMDYLFRGLFHNAKWLYLDQIIWHRASSVAILAQIAREWGPPEPILLICGDAELCEKESQDFQRYGVGARKLKTLLGQDRFRYGKLGVNAYIVQGLRPENYCNLADLFKFGDDAKWQHIWDHLLHTVLPAWHTSQGGGKADTTQDLMPWFSKIFPKEAHEENLAMLCRSLAAHGLPVEQTQNGIHLGDHHKLCLSDPWLNWASIRQNLPKTSPFTSSAGNISGQNVLTDGKNLWLTDFSKTGPAPIHWDYVSLEADVRFDWLTMDGIDPKALFKLEKELTFSSFSHPQASNMPEAYTRIIESIATVRQAAEEACNDIRQYECALLLQVLLRLARFSPDVASLPGQANRWYQRLLGACLLSEKLLEGGELRGDVLNLGNSSLNTDTKIWTIDGHELPLEGNYYAFVKTLFEARGEACSRQTLGMAVWENYKNEEKGDANRLNNLVKNLRDKIGKKGKVLLTRVKGGYQLKT